MNPNPHNDISTYRCERWVQFYHKKNHVFKMQSSKYSIISFECTNVFVLNNLKQFNNRQQKYIQNIKKHQKYTFTLSFNIKNIHNSEKCKTTVIAFKDYALIINYYTIWCVSKWQIVAIQKHVIAYQILLNPYKTYSTSYIDSQLSHN